MTGKYDMNLGGEEISDITERMGSYPDILMQKEINSVNKMDRLRMKFADLVEKGIIYKKEFVEIEDDYYGSHKHRWTANVLDFENVHVVVGMYDNKLVISGLQIGKNEYLCRCKWNQSQWLKKCAKKYFGIDVDNFEITEIEEDFDRGFWEFDDEEIEYLNDYKSRLGDLI